MKELAQSMRLGRERGKCEVEPENDREPDSPHGHLGREREREVGKRNQSCSDGLMMLISCSTAGRGPLMMRLLVR